MAAFGVTVRESLIALVLFLASGLALAQQVYSNESIIKLVKAGLSDDLIISTINGQAGKYDTSPDALIALKAAGVSDKVVAAIVLKSPETSQSTPAELPSSQPATVQQTQASPENGNSPNVESQTTQGAQGVPATGATTQPAQASPDIGTSSGSAHIQPGARVVIAPMGGFETYFAAAVREKKVPITLTLDKESAQYFVVSTNAEWRGFVYGAGGSSSWTGSSGSANFGASASSTRGLEASIMLIDAKTKDVVWAYEVHKSSHGALLFGTLAARGQQSIAEACAKHLGEYIEKGK